MEKKRGRSSFNRPRSLLFFSHASSSAHMPAGVCFHVLKRAVARLTLFEKASDYEAFERVLTEAHERVPLPIFAFCAMPNHWHFMVRPKTKHQVSEFFRWLTHTHTMRWHAHYKTQGTGHLYQGRFKTFPIEEGDHLLRGLTQHRIRSLIHYVQ